jgi:hypothetical protein
MIFGGQWDCGHFMGVGARPELRFEEKNAYRQCKACNGGSGRFAAKNATVHARYRDADRVVWIAAGGMAGRPTRSEALLKRRPGKIAAKYRRKTRELKKQRAA